MSGSFDPVTCLIPSVTGSERVLGTLFAVTNQRTAPLRVIVGDCSEAGLASLRPVRRLCRTLRLEVLRLPVRCHPNHSRTALLAAAGGGLIWFVDDDVWPAYDCLHCLLRARRRRGAAAVVGRKVEVLRERPFGGKDWNVAGDCPAARALSWCDTANLLADHDALAAGARAAATPFADKPSDVTGEDVLMTSGLAVRALCVSEPRAVAYHLPAGEERWADLGASDAAVLETLAGGGTAPAHVDWMRRVLDQSDW